MNQELLFPNNAILKQLEAMGMSLQTLPLEFKELTQHNNAETVWSLCKAGIILVFFWEVNVTRMTTNQV